MHNTSPIFSYGIVRVFGSNNLVYSFISDGKGNSKLLTYLHMHQDFQKEIVNKIHKDRRDIEKKIEDQEGSILGMYVDIVERNKERHQFVTINFFV